MAKLTKIENTEFTQISNAILAHPTLSLKAKGLYAFMYSKPNDWNFTTASMASQLKEDKKTIQRIMKELNEIGLLSYQKHSDGTGTYLLQFELPQSSQTSKNSQSPKMPPRQNASKAKCTPINNTNCSNKKDLSKNLSYSPIPKEPLAKAQTTRVRSNKRENFSKFRKRIQSTFNGMFSLPKGATPFLPETLFTISSQGYIVKTNCENNYVSPEDSLIIWQYLYNNSNILDI